MATDDRQKAALRFASGLWLVVLLALLVALARLFVRELGRLSGVTARTLLDRMSQLKPWPWKAPLSTLALALFVALLVATLAWLWIAAARRYLRGRGMP
jgi:hypothetical protein